VVVLGLCYDDGYVTAAGFGVSWLRQVVVGGGTMVFQRWSMGVGDGWR